MGQKISFLEEIRAINLLKTNTERAEAQKKLSSTKRRVIGNLRGRKVKFHLSKDVQAGFLIINVGQYVTGYASDTTDNFCKLDDPKPKDLKERRVEIIRILSIELI